MAVKEIVKLGHPALKAKSAAVDKIDDEVLELIKDLKDTLYSTTGVGLAAPQIAVNKRVIYIDLRDDMEPLVLINPVIVKKSGSQESEEGCLSYPGYYGFVDRPERITVRGYNEKGELLECKAEDLLCVALCHEIDHLDGIMYTDKARDVHPEEEEA